jgi:hypothetical protein
MKTLLLPQHPWICSISRKSPIDKYGKPVSGKGHWRRLHSTMIYEFMDWLDIPEAKTAHHFTLEKSFYSMVFRYRIKSSRRKQQFQQQLQTISKNSLLTLPLRSPTTPTISTVQQQWLATIAFVPPGAPFFLLSSLWRD